MESEIELLFLILQVTEQEVKYTSQKKAANRYFNYYSVRDHNCRNCFILSLLRLNTDCVMPQSPSEASYFKSSVFSQTLISSSFVFLTWALSLSSIPTVIPTLFYTL